MSDPEGQSEPSMEEILASIRRIISDEDEEAGAGEADEAVAADESEPIELTQEVREDGTVVDLSATKAQLEEQSDPQGEPVNQGAADPGLKVASETMEDDKKTQDDSADKGDDIELVEGESEALEEQNAPEQSPAVTAGDADQGLLAENVAVAAMTSMTEVVRAAKTTAKPTALGDGRTLEDLAREMIAPELKVWLDQNLAPLVERVVREEIKKMVRRVEDR